MVSEEGNREDELVSTRARGAGDEGGAEHDSRAARREKPVEPLDGLRKCVVFEIIFHVEWSTQLGSKLVKGTHEDGECAKAVEDTDEPQHMARVETVVHTLGKLLGIVVVLEEDDQAEDELGKKRNAPERCLRLLKAPVDEHHLHEGAKAEAVEDGQAVEKGEAEETGGPKIEHRLETKDEAGKVHHALGERVILAAAVLVLLDTGLKGQPSVLLPAVRRQQLERAEEDGEAVNAKDESEIQVERLPVKVG